MTEKRLWDYDHPFYGAEGGGYFLAMDRAREFHHTYDSWSDFLEEWDDMDEDLNFFYRFDWKNWGAGEYFNSDPEAEGGEEGDWEHELLLFVLGPRKGILISISVHVSTEDEPAVREWLSKKWDYVKKLWEPFSG